jgi:hypothetical protein
MGHNPKAFVTTAESRSHQGSAFVTKIVEMIGLFYPPNKGKV